MKTQTNQSSHFDTQLVNGGVSTQMPSAEQTQTVANPIDRSRLKPNLDIYVTLAEHESGGRAIFIY